MSKPMSIFRAIAFMGIVAFLSFDFSPSNNADGYIDRYRDLAIVEMYRTGIPASITLAQGLHESNYGTSPLATNANNHFGIKCKVRWRGKTYLHKDDDYDSAGRLAKYCFRSYDSDIDSYVDHSNFLTGRLHYQELFSYHNTDYRSWAFGLKRCGYATDPNYAQKIISKIEKYGLDQYDKWDNPLNSHR